MKKVLIPLALYADETIPLIQKNIIRNSYLQKMFKYNLMPILVAAITPPDLLDRYYQDADGVLMLGGYDINPSSYGEEPHPNTLAAPEPADKFEISLIRRTLADKKPLLAICRSAQMLNVALGGTMHQEIDDLNIDEQHNFAAMNYSSLIEGGAKHPVIIEKDSKAFKVMNQESVITNSGHHQAMNKIGKGLRVSGRTPGGIPELIELSDSDQFCFGIQAHPEAEEDSFFEPFFEKFAEAL